METHRIREMEDQGKSRSVTMDMEEEDIGTPKKAGNRKYSLNQFNNYLTFIGHTKSYDKLITDDLTHNLYSQFGDYLIFDAKISCGTALQYLSGVKGWIEENHRNCSFLADKKWLRSVRSNLQKKFEEMQEVMTSSDEEDLSEESFFDLPLNNASLKMLVEDLSAACTTAFRDNNQPYNLEGRAFLALNWACSGKRG